MAKNKMPEMKDIKTWNVEIEREITDMWKESEMFNFNPNTKKRIYSIDTPPPYINAPIHMGHATTYCYMDFFARYKRMKGFEVLFPLGLDRNGLPIEMAAEKKFKISAFDVGRDKFLEYCKKLLEETSAESIDSFAKLGISFSSYREGEKIGSVYKTDDPGYRALTQATFVELYKKGIIYEDLRINNWDPKLRTTIADSEIDYKDIESTFNDIIWKVKETGEQIVIGTTRPELICSCGMVIFHPGDKRYKHLEGKTAITPLFGKEIIIKPDSLADPEKGTGIVMMCSAGDLSDIQFFRENNIMPIISINQDGTMNQNAGFLEGLKVKDARKKIIDELKEKKLLKKQERITHRTPVSERSGAEVEFIEMPEYYLKQLDYLDDLRKISGEINFYPEESREILDRWIDSVKIDWPISRRRFYATPIPLWYAEHGGEKLIAIPSPGDYYEPWKEEVPKDAVVFKNGNAAGHVRDYKNLKWKGEERVFDTWMDSSISELALVRYRTDEKFFKKAYPVTLRPQGKEIVRTWLYYTLLRGFLETGKSCFEDVWINQHILDNNGRKMSKSLGNIVDPQKLLKEYGAEAIRLWAVLEGDLAKQDLRCSEERIKGELKTINKLLNLSKFILQFKKPKKKPELTELDDLFSEYINQLINHTDEHYEKYDFHSPFERIRFFLWEVLASNYIEIVKARAYNEDKIFSKEEQESAIFTLYYLLENLIVLLYPIIPQVTSVIGKELGIDLLKFELKKMKTKNADLSLVDKVMEFNSEVWKMKKERGVSLRENLEGAKIPKELKAFEKDLKACHKI
jgi:valyl-tRNA synthetase